MFFFAKKIESLSLREVLDTTKGVLSDSSSSMAKESEIEIKHLASIKKAQKGDLTFYSNPSYLPFIEKTNASFCLIKKQNAHLLAPETIPIFHPSPYEAFCKILIKFYGQEEIESRPEGFIAPSASIRSGAKIGKGVQIYENVVVSSDAEIADNVIILPGTYIGSKVKIGENVTIHDNVSLMFCNIGKNCIIRSGARIGTAGFGFIPDLKSGVHTYIPQVSGVLIGNNVDIGANSSIDRGCIEPTIIEDNVKIDNLVQIAHGVKAGASSFIAAQSGIAGSSEIGKMNFMGGQTAVAGHIKIPNFTRCFARTGFASSFTQEGSTMAGAPAIPYRKWLRIQVLLNQMADKKQ